jgi:hypothetical protein
VKKTSEERSVAEHNFTVLRKYRTGKALGKGVGDHEVGPKRNKLHNTSSIKLTAKMNADVNMTRRFPTNRISRHRMRYTLNYLHIF